MIARWLCAELNNMVAEYYSVAVTTAAFCASRPSSVNLRDLRGTRSCHTRYRSTAGWMLPVGYMVNNVGACTGAGCGRRAGLGVGVPFPALPCSVPTA